jgi:GNAT superfamily N-acetyltransferase
MAARVLPEHRRRGVASELVRALAEHARSLERTGINSFVDAEDEGSIAFAHKLGLSEVDYQLEQGRVVGEEPEPVVPAGIEIVSLEDRRSELLQAVWPVAQEGYEDMPLPGEIHIPLATWLRDEATRPEGSFVAYEDDAIVGYAGLGEHANGSATAEHGLTVVRRDRRGRGIARALKLAQLHWASRNGVVELITWTQKGNEAMQALNASLGYVNRSRVLTMQGPLP